MYKSKEVFMRDLKLVYDFSSSLSSELSLFYSCFDDEDLEKCEFVDSFLNSVNLKLNVENRVAAIRRLITLKEDYLISVLDNLKVSSDVRKEILVASYDWASSYHFKMFDRLNFFIGQKDLLTEFYRELMLGHKNIGLSFTKLDKIWDKAINDVNSKVLEKFDGDNSKAVSFIHENKLMQSYSDGSRADRSYSMLVEDSFEECGYSLESYGVFFEEEVSEICARISCLVKVLNQHEDSVFNLKEKWLKYFEAIASALSEKDCSKLIDLWRDVDYCWMDLDCPIQIGHCLEYYNDNLRQCVEMEWDLRIVNPELNDASLVSSNINSMYEKYMGEDGLKERFGEVYDVSKAGLNNVQLYVGKPIMYFGKFFHGFFSAQVVPNDEVVSSSRGKKIFAFADFILEIQKSSPVMKISTKVLGEDFVRYMKNVAFNKPDLWHKSYSITTIGHEFGHILWKGTDSEVVMNKTGNFKNIEEYKATTGGLVAFFNSNEVEEYWEDVFYDVVERAVKLIAWRKNKQVWPYYCEGLVHLSGMFECGVLKFDLDSEKLNIDMSRDSFDKFKDWTISTYETQFNDYLNLVDASEFLGRFAKKDSERFFMPVDSSVCEFVSWYFALYEKIGRDEDKEFNLFSE